MNRRLRLAVVTSALVGLGLIAHTVALGTITLLGASIAVLLGIGLAIPISRGVIHRVPLVASVFGAEIVIHMSLCVTSHTVDHSTVGGFVPSGSMLFWHAVAATVAMLAITFHTTTEKTESFDGRRLGETEISRGPSSYALCA
jgi:hypothetical protein